MINVFEKMGSSIGSSVYADNYTGGIMSESSHLKTWEKGDNDLARFNDEAPFRRKKMKSGLFFKLTIGMGLLAIIVTLAIPTLKEQTNNLQNIASASLDEINASEIAAILNNQNIDVSNQEEILEKKIQGKIVEWELEILVVAGLPDHYKILTKPTSKYPGTLLTLYPQNSQQVTYMDTVNPGSRIKIKGKIAGILQRRIQINPALLL